MNPSSRRRVVLLAVVALAVGLPSLVLWREHARVSRALDGWRGSGQAMTIDELLREPVGAGRPYVEFDRALRMAQGACPSLADLLAGPPYPWDQVDEPLVLTEAQVEGIEQALGDLVGDLDDLGYLPDEDPLPQLRPTVPSATSALAASIAERLGEGPVVFLGQQLELPNVYAIAYTLRDRGTVPAEDSIDADLLRLALLELRPLAAVVHEFGQPAAPDWRAIFADQERLGAFADGRALTGVVSLDAWLTLATALAAVEAGEGSFPGLAAAELDRRWSMAGLFEDSPVGEGLGLRLVLLRFYLNALESYQGRLDGDALAAESARLASLDLAREVRRAVEGERVLGHRGCRLLRGDLGADELLGEYREDHAARALGGGFAPWRRLRALGNHGRFLAHANRASAALQSAGLELFRPGSIVDLPDLELEPVVWLWAPTRGDELCDLAVNGAEVEALRRMALCALDWREGGERALEASLAEHVDPLTGFEFERLDDGAGITTLHSAGLAVSEPEGVRRWRRSLDWTLPRP
ncbi:hypothetical protein [Engelhardtia mirabilis]